MAITTKKKPRPKVAQPAPVAKRRRPVRTAPAPSIDDIDEPERSSPSMAEVDAEALEFIAAIDRFKKEHGRPFPSWSEVLLIVRQLGYRRA